MNIDKAIENRERYLKNSTFPKSTEDYNSTLMSIEALKHYRDSSHFACGCLLLGQTRETED